MEDNKTYKLLKLFSVFSSKNGWSIGFLDKELFPTIMYTINQEKDVNIYDVRKYEKIIIEIPASESQCFYNTESYLHQGLNYIKSNCNGILTQLCNIPFSPTDPINSRKVKLQDIN